MMLSFFGFSIKDFSLYMPLVIYKNFSTTCTQAFENYESLS